MREWSLNVREMKTYQLFKQIAQGEYVSVTTTGIAEGENRIAQALKTAYEFSPWLKLHLKEAKEVYLVLTCSESDPIRMDEIHNIHDFFEANKDIELIWDVFFDKTDGKEVKAVLIGCFEKNSI